jgi:hypothetical protein
MPAVAFNVQEMRAVARNVRGIFYDAMKGSPTHPILSKIFFVIQSNAIIEKFVMMRGAPKMRHWTGDRQASALSAQSFQIEKKDWESTITITRDDLQHDRLGLIRPQIQELARAYPRHLVDYGTTSSISCRARSTASATTASMCWTPTTTTSVARPTRTSSPIRSTSTRRTSSSASRSS